MVRSGHERFLRMERIDGGEPGLGKLSRRHLSARKTNRARCIDAFRALPIEEPSKLSTRETSLPNKRLFFISNLKKKKKSLQAQKISS